MSGTSILGTSIRTSILARQKLGPRFELAAFHDVVLEGGVVPLPMLRERVELWVRNAP